MLEYVVAGGADIAHDPYPTFFITRGVDSFGEYVISWSGQLVCITIVRFAVVEDELSEIVATEL